MGLHPPQTGSQNITTTPFNLTSENATAYAYHHVKIFFTGTFQSADRYEIRVLYWDPVAGTYVRGYADEVNFITAGNTTTDADQDKVWEISPTPSVGVRLTITKLAGNDRTINYEIIRAT